MWLRQRFIFMRRLINILSILALLLAFSYDASATKQAQLGLYAQTDSLEVAYRLSGLITDAQTGEPVPFVSVHNGPIWNTHADINGVYSLNLPAGLVKLKFSTLGYEDCDVEVNLSQDIELNVVLEPAAIVEYNHFKRWEIDWKAFNCYGFSNMYDGAMTMF